MDPAERSPMKIIESHATTKEFGKVTKEAYQHQSKIKQEMLLCPKCKKAHEEGDNFCMCCGKQLKKAIKLKAYPPAEERASVKDSHSQELHGKTRVLTMVKEIRETTDPKIAAQLLSSGKWIAIYAVENGDVVTFSLGRIS